MPRKNAAVARRQTFLVIMTMGVSFCLVNTVYLHQSFQLDSLEHQLNNLVSTNNTHNTTFAQDSEGKERLLWLLRDAGYTAISRESLRQLPTWEHVVKLYGDSPKIVGLETCKAFRNSIDPRKALLAPAGPFNSGTNLLSSLLWNNCALPKLRRKLDHYGKRWQVNYGKHQPPRTRAYHQVYKSINNTFELPIVIVRDPYTWMQSMCRHGYTAHWFHTTKHCPNFIPSDIDYVMLESPQHDDNVITPLELDGGDYVDDDDPEANFSNTTKVIPVSVKYNFLTTHHESLAHMWNDWYDEYVQADFPRIFVRMEDLVFHARNVTETMCKCAGGRLARGARFQYTRRSAKEEELHEGQLETTMLDAMIRYGSAKDRTKGMTIKDKEFAQSVISHDLMELFGYTFPQDETVTTSGSR